MLGFVTIFLLLGFFAPVVQVYREVLAELCGEEVRLSAEAESNGGCDGTWVAQTQEQKQEREAAMCSAVF